jgi:hypothetical protein
MLLCAGALVWHCSARDGAAGHVCVCACQRALADVVAGATWTRVIASARWAARYLHTTVINAAGAIYVIGGSSSSAYLNDVWVSTDAGADGAGALLAGLLVRTVGVLAGVLQGYCRGTAGVLQGYYRGTCR